MHENSPQVLIPDQTVEKAVREALNKPKGQLTSGEMASLRELKIVAGEEDDPVQSISGLEYAYNLTHLYIRGGYLENLFLPPELASLKKLELYGCYIGNPEGLENLSRLEELTYVGYPLNDLQTFAGLKGLRRLKVMGLSSLKGARELSGLTELDFSTRYPLDLSPLQEMDRLKKLRLKGHYITGLNVLGELDRLEELLLESREAKELDSLKNLVGLKRLCLRCSAEEWLPAWMPQLEELEIEDNWRTHLPVWPGMEKLKKLTLCMGKLKNINSIAGLKKLEELHLWTQELVDLQSLSEATALKRLYLRGNVENVEYLCGLKELQKLELKACVSTQPEAPPLYLDFSSLNNLEELHLQWNVCSKDSNFSRGGKTLYPAYYKGLVVQGLETLPELRRLSVGGNVLIDRGMLAELKNLQALTIFLENFLYLEEGKNAPRAGAILSNLKQLRSLVLKSLDLSGERIGDLSVLKGLEELELILKDQVELENVAGLSNLKLLNVDTTTLDIKKLVHMTKLEEIRASADEIKNIGLLAGFANLKTVEITELG